MPDRAKVGILAALAAAAVLSLASGLSVFFGKGGSAPRAENAAPAAAAPPAVPKRPPKSSFVGFKRDPFLYSAKPAFAFVLDGVAWDEKEPRAVVNGEIVAVGDRVAEWTVERIEKSAVTLGDGVRKIELTLGEEP